MTKHHGRDDVAALINSDRDLTPDEQAQLGRMADAAWSDIRTQLIARSHNTYAIAEPDDFAQCVSKHMATNDLLDMVAAEAYHCPACGRHLKDRRTPVASSVLIERRRLRELYLNIERAPDDQREEALRRFIAALGVTS